MEIVDRYGLTLALVEPHELADEPWLRAGPHIDVVRVPDPPASAHPLLAAHGFLRKPRAVTWITELGRDDEVFLARLRRLARRDIGRARRRAVAGGLREMVEDPVMPRTLDAFLTLYADRVAAMRFGVPFALGHRDAVLNGPEKFYGVFARDPAGALVGGCLVREEPDRDAAVIRFSAVTARWRRAGLARVLYLSAMRIARDKGHRYATLSNEPNLVGHLTKPGLFLFKANLGFETIPSQQFGDPEGKDEADLVRHVAALHDPTLILGYTAGACSVGAPPGDTHTEVGGPAPAQPVLAAHLYHAGEIADAGRYTAPFLAPTVLHRVPANPPATEGPAFRPVGDLAGDRATPRAV